MKKLMAVLSVVAILIGGTIQVVQAQGFLLGALIGASLFGGDKNMGGSDATILYVLDRVSERVASPLDVRLLSFEYEMSSPEYTKL